MKKLISSIVLVGACTTGVVQAQTTFVASLTGSQQTPPNGSTAVGFGTVILSADETQITVNESWSGLTGGPASATHIHGPGAPGVAAGVLFPLSGVENATSGSVPQQTFPINATQVGYLQSGLLYFNIHNASYPGGEIRGQLVRAAYAVTPTDEYSAVVVGHGPKAYYRFNDSLVRSNINFNSGSLGAAGNLTNTFNLRAFPGAIAGDGNGAQFFNTASSYGMIPFNPAMNPDNTHPFTVEAWFYPANDQQSNGQSPINNRVAGSTANRTGWVFFQRAPDDSYSSNPAGGYEGVGWDCRMYYLNGSSGGLEVKSGVPYVLGRWTHVVVVYDPVQLTNMTLTMYIDGVPANTNIWTGGSDGLTPGYISNDPTNVPALSLGAYNNASGAGGNPYFGGIDEFAWYPYGLTAAQILAHYQNATNANRSTPYDVLIKSDNPVTYLRLGEPNPGPDLAINLGDLYSAADATYSPLAKHPGVGLAEVNNAGTGSGTTASFSGHTRYSGGSYANVPFQDRNNPDASVPFTFELWVRAYSDLMNPGPSPINNRLANTATDRSGWIIYQRDPNSSYTGTASSGEGVGYAFRVYNGNQHNDAQVVTQTPYNLGDWTHLVFTWQPVSDVGPTPSGPEEWTGVLTAYQNGVAVATNAAANYAANTNSPSGNDLGLTPADFNVGSYNAASGFGEEFEGDIAEVAIYTNYVLTADQVLAHYQAGTNTSPATNYESLVLTAVEQGTPGTEHLMPVLYLRFNEPAHFPAANSGSLGSTANGADVNTQNSAAGPVTAGFNAGNSAVPVDPSVTNWVSLNSPAGLNISGQITLEAWIKGGATQNDPARIISHGPPTPTFVPDPTLVATNGNLLGSNEVFLRLEGAGANYSVGSFDGTNFHGVTYPVPTGDLGGSNWVHLVGTYDGAKWNLYRNGALVTSAADAVGALAVGGAEWAIGSTGMGWGDFFTGSIDEVAIYDRALTATQVADHYYISQHGSVTLSVSQSGGTTTLTWPAGTLQQADEASGPYTDLASASSPYNPPAGPARKFYRLKL